MKRLMAVSLPILLFLLPAALEAKTGDTIAGYAPVKTHVTRVENWVVRVEDETGVARTVLADGQAHLRKAPVLAKPREIAMEYIERNALLLFGEHRAPEFAVDEVIESMSGHHVHLRQTVNGIPVFNSYISVHSSRDGHVLLVNNGSHPGAHIDRVDPVIRLNEAIKRARKHKAISGELRSDIQTELVVYKNSADFRLSWMVLIPANEPLGDWLIIVDAASGEILHEKDILMYVDGTGVVFTPNPVVTSSDYTLRDGDPTDQYRFQRTLPELDGSGYLTGPLALANNSLGGRAHNDSTFIFLYSSMVSQGGHFEEVMYYYHVDAFQRYIQSLGIVNANNRRTIANVHGTSADNSWYSQASKQITYGYGGVNDAADAEIILHEYGHAVHDDIVPGFTGYQAGALSEGFSDFVGTGFFEDPWVGEWDATSYNPGSPSFLRRLNTGMIYPDSLVQQVHWDGQIFSGACWDFQQVVGKDLAFQLVVEGLFYTGPSSGMVDAADGVAAADLAIYGGEHITDIRTAFGGRGLGTAYELSIFHTPISDIEDTTGPYQVVAMISHTDPLDDDSLLVHYRTNGGAFTDIVMQPTGSMDEYYADIPGQSSGSTVDYYISVMDLTGYEAFDPLGAPGADLHTFRVGADTIGPEISHVPLGNHFFAGWPAVAIATITDNFGVDDSTVQVEHKLNDVDQTPFTLTRTYADKFIGPFNSNVSVGDTIAYRIVAGDTAATMNVTYHPASGYHTFRILQEIGNVLVIDDDTGDRPSHGHPDPLKSGSIQIIPMTLPGDEVAGVSALQMKRALENEGYHVVAEAATSTSPTTWPDYDFIISSSGADTDPVSSPIYRSAVEQYVTGGGRLLVEGGEVGWVSVTGGSSPGPYPAFAENVLHTDSWMGDNSGALVVVDTFSNHPIATSPNPLPSTIPITYGGYGDQDAEKPTSDAYMVYATSSHPNHAGIVVYEDTLSVDARIVYYAFNYHAVTDSIVAAGILANTAAFLMSESRQRIVGCCPESIMPGIQTTAFEVLSCFPNPFNPATTISYQIPAAGDVAVEVFDVRGALVTSFDEGVVGSGIHSVRWDGTDTSNRPLGSGLYFYRVRWEQEERTGKVLLLK